MVRLGMILLEAAVGSSRNPLGQLVSGEFRHGQICEHEIEIFRFRFELHDRRQGIGPAQQKHHEQNNGCALRVVWAKLSPPPSTLQRPHHPSHLKGGLRGFISAVEIGIETADAGLFVIFE